jgi:uncharacterized YccA/Bax inhibitor family protein
MFRSQNPAGRNDVFGPSQTWGATHAMTDLEANRAAEKAAARTHGGKSTGAANSMTVQGTINKTALLLAMCVTTAVVAWELTMPQMNASGEMVSRVSPMLLLLAGAIGGLVIALVTIFKPRWAPVTAPLYALTEGFFVGAVSGLYAVRMANPAGEGFDPDGSIVLQAALGTFGVFASMLILYTTRIIKPTQKLKSGVVVATGGVMLLYATAWILSFFGIAMPFLSEPNPIGIVISLVIIGIAALNFVLDFDYIEQGVANRAPKWAEWFGGFTLLVTLIWLYIEMLRLIWMVRSLMEE